MEYVLAWVEEHQGPLDEKTTRELQRGRFPKGLFKAFATEHPAVAKATGVASRQEAKLRRGPIKKRSDLTTHE